MKRFLKLFISFILASILITVALLAAASYLNKPAGLGGQEEYIFTVKKGDSLNIIAEELAESGAVKYPWPLVLYSKILGTQTEFKIGSYRLRPDMTLTEIHDLLVEGRQKLYRLTIPEGWSSKSIATLLDAKGITERDSFLAAVSSEEILKDFSIPGNSLEGYLYPDTYMFQLEFPAEKVVRVMVENFFSKLSEIYPEYENLGPDEVYNKVILASIVEREYRDPDEAALMAGVFYNRLNSSEVFPLGSCATIVYILTDIMDKPHPEVVTYRDLEIQSPYNTYRNAGLPPGPISNPGEIALKASFFPENSDYLYFLLKNPESGKHEFTRTLSDHNAAYNLYIKGN